MKSTSYLPARLGMLVAGTFGSLLLAWTELAPEWITRLPSNFADTLDGMVVDSSGTVYLSGSTGPSNSRSIWAAVIEPDGTVRWSRVLGNGTGGQLALGADGTLYIVGGSPGAGGYSNVILFQCDPQTGNILNTYRYSSGAGISESAGWVAVDFTGNIYLAGGTVGDGADVLLLKLNSNLQLQWVRTWDGPALVPYSQDGVRGLRLDPAGNPIVLVHAVMADNQPDYMVIKYGADGTLLWQQNWGTRAQENPMAMVLDAAGDIYVTGVASNFTFQRATIKIRGSDGQLLWAQYDDSTAQIDRGAAIALDGQGGVYATGTSDPEGNISNFNDNFYTTKRGASSGTPLFWSHFYGQNCVGCYDVPADIRVDSAGHVIVVGQTSSAPYVNDMILMVLDSQTGQELDRGAIDGGGASWRVLPGKLRLDAHENIYVGALFNNVDTGVAEPAVIKYRSLVRQAGDVDGNGCVDDADLLRVLFAFGCSSACGAEDVNRDGVVDDADLLIVLFNFGGGC